MSHTYKEGKQGRGFVLHRGVGRNEVTLACSERGCGAVGRLTLTGSLLPPEVLDKKFRQKGWDLDPHVCPECIERKQAARRLAKEHHQQETRVLVAVETKRVKEEKEHTMADTISDQLKPASAAAHKATAALHKLLSTHFDPDAGHYAQGWSDQKVAQETGLAEKYVSEVRDIVYGALKEPDELVAIRNEVKSLQELINETLVAAQREVNQLNNRINQLAKDFGFKPGGGK